jgi:hypothetical protein
MKKHNGSRAMKPPRHVPADQRWFWTQEWQAGEREAEEDIRRGRVYSFRSAARLISWLNRPKGAAGNQHAGFSKVQQVDSAGDVQILRREIQATMEISHRKVLSLLRSYSAISVFKKLRFEERGLDPLDRRRRLNFVEQLNQTFSYFVSLKAADYLLTHEKCHRPFKLNLGTSKGPDIESLDGVVAAEVFAATSPDSNDKLKKDIQRLANGTAERKYVFYYSPVGHKSAVNSTGVQIIRFKKVP